jgi:hypothetical protein
MAGEEVLHFKYIVNGNLNPFWGLFMQAMVKLITFEIMELA